MLSFPQIIITCPNDRLVVAFLRVKAWILKHIACQVLFDQQIIRYVLIECSNQVIPVLPGTGDGPVDAAFNCIKELVSHTARLQLYQVHAVTGGTDAQAEVTVRLEEEGRTVDGRGADTDTMVASVKAYVNALNKLMVKRQKTAPDALSA